MKSLLISIKITGVFCAVLFLGYVMVLWGVSAAVTPSHGQAEVLTLNGRVVGASNVAQAFTSEHYFWPRPSAVDYNGSGSGGSNKGFTNPDYLAEVAVRVDSFMVHHPYLDRSEVPAEMVTASASGLDPHISPLSASVQAQRVANARGMSVDSVKALIEQVTQTPIIGMPVVNVLKLNIALDNQLSLAL